MFEDYLPPGKEVIPPLFKLKGPLGWDFGLDFRDFFRFAQGEGYWG